MACVRLVVLFLELGVAAEEAAHTHTHTHTYTHTGRLLDELLRLLEGGIGLDEDSQKSVP